MHGEAHYSDDPSAVLLPVVSDLLRGVAFQAIRDLETMVPVRLPRQPCGDQDFSGTRSALEMLVCTYSVARVMLSLFYLESLSKKKTRFH